MDFQDITVNAHIVRAMALRVLYCTHKATQIHGREFVTSKEIDDVYLATYDRTISGRIIAKCKTRNHASSSLSYHGFLATGSRLWGHVRYPNDARNRYYWFVTNLGSLTLDMLLNNGSRDDVANESSSHIARRNAYSPYAARRIGWSEAKERKAV